MPRRANSAWPACMESLSHPGRGSPGGRNRMPAVNGVGVPCAGEPHARFEVAGTGNGADLAKDTGAAQPAGKPAATKAPGPKASEQPRQSPTLQRLSGDHFVLEMHEDQD